MDLAAEALKGSQLAGARLIRLLEERDPAGIEGLKALYPHSGSAHSRGGIFYQQIDDLFNG